MTVSSAQKDRDAAAHFIARMDADDWSEGDEAALQHWLADNTMRHGLLLQMQAQWVALTPAVAEDEQGDEEPEPVAPTMWGRRGILAGLAASVTLAIGGARWVESASDYTTELGEIRRLPLSDGSVMTMNSGSALKVNMARQAREIQLAQGEAWFEVAKDASRPFVVSAGDVRVRAVGTAFSVRRRETGVEVLVTEGVVETWAGNDESLHMRLKAGDRAMLSGHAVIDYETGISSSVDRTLAWRSGMIDLNGRTLFDAADEFNRYNQRQIIIADPRIAREEFDGLFRINDPEGFSEAVKTSLGVSLDTSNPDIIRLQ